MSAAFFIWLYILREKLKKKKNQDIDPRGPISDEEELQSREENESEEMIKETLKIFL